MRVAEGPEDQKRPAGERCRLAHLRSAVEPARELRETPDMRIFGIVAVVAHHEIAIFRNAIGRAPVLARRHVGVMRVEHVITLRVAELGHIDAVVADLQIVAGPLSDIGLDERLAVQIDDSVPDGEPVARPSDHALDEVIGRGNRRRKDDDVAFARAHETVLELVDQQHVADLQCGNHRSRWYVVGARHERNQEERR